MNEFFYDIWCALRTCNKRRKTINSTRIKHYLSTIQSISKASSVSTILIDNVFSFSFQYIVILILSILLELVVLGFWINLLTSVSIILVYVSTHMQYKILRAYGCKNNKFEIKLCNDVLIISFDIG